MDEFRAGPVQATDYPGAFEYPTMPSWRRLLPLFLRRPITIVGAWRRHRRRLLDQAALKEALRIQKLTDPERARLEYLEAVFASLDRGGIKFPGLEATPTPLRIISDGIARVDLERLVRDVERERERDE